MARQLSPEREREFVELSGYMDYFATHVIGVDPASAMHPTNALKGIVEGYGRSKALDGLRQAANDTVQSLDGKPGVVQALDEALRGNGLLGFYEVAHRYGSAYRKILKRGRIKSETEYYLVHGALVDGGSLLADDERVELAKLTEDFESAMADKRL